MLENLPRSRLQAKVACLFILSATALGQGTPPRGGQETPPKGGLDLTPQQISERLEQVKAEIIPKVMPTKTAADAEKKKSYLAKWQVVPSEHYILFTNGPTATCKKYAASLERLYVVVKKELGIEDPASPLVAY